MNPFTMETVYAAGVVIIEFIQYWFKDYATFFALVNDLSNPHYQVEYVFPAVSIVDSVFATQFILCMAFGGWLNAVMKWWLLECRPYWWVQYSTYYAKGNRPRLLQTSQSCETGPGSPSGHSTSMAMTIVLFGIWILHVMNDRKFYIWWWKYLVYPLFAFALISVMLARLFVATHFPHQTVLGAFIGLFLAPALCIYVTDPQIWSNGSRATVNLFWRIVSALTCIAIAFVTYWSLKLCGVDPQWTVQMAFRWCENPDNIHVSTTPMYALVQSTGTLLGCAVAITPQLAKYRHYTKNRSLLIALTSTFITTYASTHFINIMPKDNAMCYYSMLFVAHAVKTVMLLRVCPWLAAWPWNGNGAKSKTE